MVWRRSLGMTKLSEYLQIWRLKLSYWKTVTAVFHLKKQETKRELTALQSYLIPTYLEIKLDRFLTFRHYIKILRNKLKSPVTLLKQLVWRGCAADAKTLLKTVIFLAYPTSECCVPT